MFVWENSVFTWYSYYCDFFCLGPAWRLCDCHIHGWVRYIDTTKITITFNFWSITTITATKFMLSNQATTERWGFIRDQPIVVWDIVTLIYIDFIHQFQAIHYCNQLVLKIYPYLNVTYLVLQLLISFIEATWYSVLFCVSYLYKSTGVVCCVYSV